ncbi:MAG: exodeoxyribonuclease VII large subunit [Acidobacteria bacterium]|nr:exodeoxyribonuclease VII large subunit [Acidobacteriota bacterium]MCW5968530.1 exodeoxyribonuclease VII large subunit [Blastocatellales bacterium]
MPDSTSRIISSLFAERRVYSVTELTLRIREMLEGEFFDIEVKGEISNFKRHTSGHWYFTLKDSEAQLRAVFFRQWNRLLRFAPEQGLEVRVRGRLSVYAVRGEYELIVEMMEPVGIGTLQLAFEQQQRRLAAEGLFDQERKRPLPLLPRGIGIVTAPTGAVIRDMLQILARRNRSIPILVAPVRVQGRGAAREIAEAIELLNREARNRSSSRPIDVIVLARGGGSIEDLWAFNEEIVARAIVASQIPVVSAVGHETDFTIADFVADLRAPTPSAAAEMIAPSADDLRARVEELNLGLARVMNFLLLQRRSRLREIASSPGFLRAAERIRALAGRWRELEARAGRALEIRVNAAQRRLHSIEQRLSAHDFRGSVKLAAAQTGGLEARLVQAINRRIERNRGVLEVRAGQLDMLSPLAVLGRGYLLARNRNGRLVARAAALQSGDEVRLRFADGEAQCRIEGDPTIYAEDQES